MFSLHHIEERALKGKLAGKCLVHQHTKTVPIARRRERLRSTLFGRHIPDCTCESPLGVCIGGVQFRDQAVVQQLDSAVSRDQNIARLDISMETMGSMQGVNTQGELKKYRPYRKQMLPWVCPGV